MKSRDRPSPTSPTAQKGRADKASFWQSIFKKLSFRTSASPPSQEDWVPLASLMEFLPSAPPPNGLLARVERTIEEEADRATKRPRSPKIVPLRTFAVLSFAAGAALMAAPAFLWSGLEKGEACPPQALADLVTEDRSIMVRVEALECGRYLRLHRSGTAHAKRAALELWLLPGSGQGPVSLGLLAAKGGVTLLPLPMALMPGDSLALTWEPVGGSPYPWPSGFVLSQARLAAGNHLNPRSG